jgi:class 3 adenylate cyclase
MLSLVFLFFVNYTSGSLSYQFDSTEYHFLIHLDEMNIKSPQTRSWQADSIAQNFIKKGDTCSYLFARVVQSRPLYESGEVDSSVQLLLSIGDQIHSKCDSSLYLRYIVKLSFIHLGLEDFNSALNICSEGIQLCGQGRPSRELVQLVINKANALSYLGFTSKAITEYRQSIDLATRLGDMNFINNAHQNLGVSYANQAKFDSARYFFTQANEFAQHDRNISAQINLLANLATLETAAGDFDKAFYWLDSIASFPDSLMNWELMAEYYYARSVAFEFSGDFQQALDNIWQYMEIRDSILNEERINAVADMREKYETAKKANQIKELEVSNLNAVLANQKIARTRNLYLYSGIGILILAIGLGNRLQFIRRSRNIIQKEKKKSDDLLLNILPYSVAEELKSTGFSRARKFDNVTILFSDFQGFTHFSESMDPEALVEEIDYCFKGFDQIITRHHIEKIKTIGDAYMAAGGLHTDQEVMANKVVQAGLDMQQFIRERALDRKSKDLPYFQMRLGINTGTVVAGVVGEKKFQYDIWGDAVNIASRMESNGQVDKVNVSHATYKLVKDNFACVYRGEFPVKGKGNTKMYFVESTIS